MFYRGERLYVYITICAPTLLCWEQRKSSTTYLSHPTVGGAIFSPTTCNFLILFLSETGVQNTEIRKKIFSPNVGCDLYKIKMKLETFMLKLQSSNTKSSRSNFIYIRVRTQSTTESSGKRPESLPVNCNSVFEL
jgi:hypothetical protein